MGKGATTCEREALVLEDTKPLPKVGDFISYTEYLKALVSDLAVEPQNLEFVLKEIKRHPRQVKAIMVEDSECKDHVIYAEMGTREKFIVSYQAICQTPLSHAMRDYPDVMKPDVELSQEGFKTWKKQATDLTSNAIKLKDSDLNDQLIEEHFKSQAPDLYSPDRLTWFKASLKVDKKKRFTESEERELIIRAELRYGYNESELTSKLQELGAEIAQNKLKSYDVPGGKQLVVDTPEGRISFVPRTMLGEREVEAIKVSITPRINEELIKELADDFEGVFDKHKVMAGEVYLVEEGSKRYLKAKATMEEKELEKFEKLLESKDPKASRKVSLATHEELAEFPDYYKPYKDGFMYHRTFKKYQNYQQAKDRLPELKLEWVREREADFDKELERACKREKLGKECNELLGKLHTKKALEISEEKFIHKKPIKHDAPLTERGVIEIRGGSLESGLSSLKDLGLIKGVAQEIPKEANRMGRLNPKHPAYLSGVKVPTLKEGSHLYHALTGDPVRGCANPLEKLESIIKTGGLKSNAERRRMGIQGPSLDPRGDIGQGIDCGVPASLGRTPSYERYSKVFFQISPEALTRRDIWFSPRTLWSLKDYNNYAKKLGQDHIHAPCPPEATQKHLKDPGTEFNEVFFKDEVRLDEIETILTSDPHLQPKIQKLLDKYRKEGLVPKGLNCKSANKFKKGGDVFNPRPLEL